jgi:hypothetical protein
VSIRRLERIAVIVTIAWVAGCAPMPPGDGDPGQSRLQQLAAAGDWNAVANAKVRCREGGEACAQEHATKGDACLRLVIKQPQSASASDGRTRALLDCAEDSYRKALQLSPSKTAPSRISYHGGLLLTLSERRNRLDDQAGEGKRERENEKLLIAAQDARREVPNSALGYLYGASAHVYRAALKPEPRHRCNDLRQAEAMLRRSPPPPSQLAAEQARIKSLVARELRESRCTAIRRR